MIRWRCPLPSYPLDSGYRSGFLTRPRCYLPEGRSSLFIGDVHLAICPIFQNDFPGCRWILDLVQRPLMDDRVVAPDRMLGSDTEDTFQLSWVRPAHESSAAWPASSESAGSGPSKRGVLQELVRLRDG